MSRIRCFTSLFKMYTNELTNGVDQAEAGSDHSGEALFFAKYSSARARFLDTDGFTHFFRPGKVVNEQPTASSFSFAAAENARALKFSFTVSSPSPRICIHEIVKQISNQKKYEYILTSCTVSINHNFEIQ